MGHKIFTITALFARQTAGIQREHRIELEMSK
jgi:hypothetical protein